jgi:hypothetical protein
MNVGLAERFLTPRPRKKPWIKVVLPLPSSPESAKMVAFFRFRNLKLEIRNSLAIL